MPDPFDVEFTGSRAWNAEGARIAVVTCKMCGAAIVIDPMDVDEFSATEVHAAWHGKPLPMTRETTIGGSGA